MVRLETVSAKQVTLDCWYFIIRDHLQRARLRRIPSMADTTSTTRRESREGPASRVVLPSATGRASNLIYSKTFQYILIKQNQRFSGMLSATSGRTMIASVSAG